MFRHQLDAFAGLADRDRDIANFAVVYTFEAHPDDVDLVALESPIVEGSRQRLVYAQELRRAHSLRIPIYVDPVDVEFGKHFGFAEWSYLILSKNGEVLQYGPDGLGDQSTDDLDHFLQDLRQTD